MYHPKKDNEGNLRQSPNCPLSKILAVLGSLWLPVARLLARILKVGVQILCGTKAQIAWRRRRHAPRGVWGHGPPENFEKLKPLRYDFHDSDSCKRLSIYLLNRWFSFIILLSYPFLNLPCVTLNNIWDRNSSCYEKNSRRDP